ncbi:MAG: DNA (cytosine-5-)-methyltransferase [Vagococcus sp.]
MTLKFIDFFAGVGGFRKGLEMAGHECVGFVEWDKFARQSYQAIFETEGEYTENDIRAVRANELPKANIWCFGFPCQDISIAGKQEGFDGERSSLFYGVTKLIRELKKEDKPEYLFIENVKNLLSVNDGFDFLRLQVELDEIGYNLEWDVLNSKYFGVPQNRERAFIIGHLRGKHTRKVFPFRGEENPVDSEQSKIVLKGNTNPSGGGMNGNVFEYSGLSPTLTTNKGEGLKIAIPVITPDRAEKRQNGRRFKENQEEMFTLTAQDRHGVMVVGKVEAGGFDNNGNIHDDNGVSPTITTRNGGEQGIKIIQKGRGFNKGGEYDIAPTLTSNSYHENNMLRTDDFQIRKLTPLECWRLQGWEDEMFYRAKFGSKEIARRIIVEGIDHYNCEFEQTMSDSQLYKQAGNGVTVTVIYEIAKRLEIEVE